MNELLDIKYWAGTEESFGVYLLCLKKMIDNGDFEKFAATWASGQQAEPTQDVPRLFQKAGDVGIIKIAGPLNNSDSVMNRYYGMTGYPEIRDALIYAARQQDIGAVMLDVSSGGGAVAGVFDTARLISTIDTQVKPVHAFSGGGIMSAAYLLGVSARSVKIDQMAEAGSIGVVAVHQEMSKMLKDIGITPTVLRSGKYKALGNPFEPLSDAAKAEMQGQIDYLAGIFDQHVADHRGTTAAVVNEKMGQGRVFIGQQAKDVGLVDGITSFDAAVSKVQGGIDSSKDRTKYGANSTNKNDKGMQAVKTPLTEQDIAAMAEGAGAGAQPTEEQKAAAASALAASEKAAADKIAADKLAADAAAGAGTKPVTEPTGLQVVQGQLVESQAKVTELTIELRDLNTKTEAMKGSHASMRAIAVASVKRLKVALGQTAGGEEALDDAALLASHDALRTTFETKFKAGGVAAVTTGSEEDSNKGGATVAEAQRQGRIAATRSTAKK